MTLIDFYKKAIDNNDNMDPDICESVTTFVRTNVEPVIIGG